VLLGSFHGPALPSPALRSLSVRGRDDCALSYCCVLTLAMRCPLGGRSSVRLVWRGVNLAQVQPILSRVPRPNCRRRGGLAVSSKSDVALVLHTLASWAFPPRLHALAAHPSLCPTLALCLPMTATLFIVEHPGYPGKRGPTRAKYRALASCCFASACLAGPPRALSCALCKGSGGF
jgi:hypothetical protein